MEMIHKSYKVRLYPTKEQVNLLDRHFGCNRFIYNHFLNENKELYDKEGKKLTQSQMSKMLTEMKNDENLSWLKEVNSQTLQQSLGHLEDAYGNFFKGQAKFPKFKRKNGKETFTCPQHVYIMGDNRLKITKFSEGIKFRGQNIPLEAVIRNTTVSKTPTGEYYASITCMVPKFNKLPKTNKAVGIDLGMDTYAVFSDRTVVEAIKPLKKALKKLEKQQQSLSRKQINEDKSRSNRYKNQVLKVTKTHQKITRLRMDFIHKLSWFIVKNYDIICLETLDINALMKTNGRGFGDASFGELIRCIKYKAEWYGREVIQISKWFSSSKNCSKCQEKNKDLGRGDKEWTCPSCNIHHECRDYNASVNILLEGLRLLLEAEKINKNEYNDYIRDLDGYTKSIKWTWSGEKGSVAKATPSNHHEQNLNV